MSKAAIVFIFTILTGASIIVHQAQADESMSKKATEVANDSKRATKKAVRAVKDKTCELVNGKMECAAQKAKHAVQNGADVVEDALD